jgi:hypothetical protein
VGGVACLHCVGVLGGDINIERSLLSSEENKGVKEIALLKDAVCSHVCDGQLLSYPAACNVTTAIHLRRLPVHVNP